MENAETDCRTVLERLYLYLDGELPDAGCAEIEQHLERCVACLGLVGFERELKQIVGRKCAQKDVPDGLMARLREKIRGS
jgi:mycothiol system anti-sigma-R factor